MKTIHEIRYDNLERLVRDAAGPDNDIGVGLSRLVGNAKERGKALSRPTLYQILTKRTTAAGTVRNVGDDIARAIEDALRLEAGWMDNVHDVGPPQPSVAVPTAELAEVVAEVASVYWRTDEIGRRVILSALQTAKDRPSVAPSNNKLERR